MVSHHHLNTVIKGSCAEVYVYVVGMCGCEGFYCVIMQVSPLVGHLILCKIFGDLYACIFSYIYGIVNWTDKMNDELWLGLVTDY